MPDSLTCDDRGRIYCTLAYFEDKYGRSTRTLRDWISTSQVRSLIEGQAVYVHLGDARKLDMVTPRQDRRKTG